MTERKLSEIVLKGGAAALVTTAGAAQAQDVSGPYAGLSYGLSRGTVDYLDSYSFDGGSAGLFLGYNVVQGDWLYGGEIALAGNHEIDDSDTYGGHANQVIDLKARVGKTFGHSLFYGVVGYSTMDLEFDDACCNQSTNGLSLGIGFETGVGANGFIGGEILSRDIDTNPNDAPYVDGGRLNTISLRAGLRF